MSIVAPTEHPPKSWHPMDSVSQKRKRPWDGTDGVLPSRTDFAVPQMLHSVSEGTPQQQNSMQFATMNVQKRRSDQPQHGDNNARRFTACEACRKMKVKCDMVNDSPPCTRCQRRNLECVTNRAIQSLMEDAKKIELLSKDIMNLHETLDDVCRHLDVTVPKPLISKYEPSKDDQHSSGNSGGTPDCEVSPPLSPSAVHAPIDTFLEAAKLGSPGSADQSSLQRKPYVQSDLIGKGLISLKAAEHLFARYFTRLDHYLYGIGSIHKDMKGTRQASPILTAAICTVSALHEPGPDQALYDVCNRELRRLVSRSLFEKRDIEFIRAMVIASFWLSDASRIFSANGIRRAADARLHRHFRQAVSALPPPVETHNLNQDQLIDRVRLWYLLFISDQHMSIIHNRDSLLRVDRHITNNWEAFLDRASREDNDVRILSQVSLLLIMGQARDTLGVEPDERLAASMTSQLNGFSRQIDRWYSKFVSLFKPNEAIGGFPTKGLQLHYHFSKLHLGHHVFQGLRGEALPSSFMPAAIMAHNAAISIFEMVSNDSQLQSDLIGTPHYFHIMIAFAGHFIIEICEKYSEQLSLDMQSDLALLGNVLSWFEQLHCTPQHPIRRMTLGLGRKLFDCAARMNVLLTVPPRLQTPAPQMSHMHFSNLADYRMEPGQLGAFDELAMAQMGEFQFPDMSLNFMA